MADLISRAAALRCIMQSRENIDWGQSDDCDAFLRYTGALYRTMASSDCMPAVDAVPVEWLREWQDEVGTLNEWWPIIERIITVWHEEQEAR